ncbi:MAG TPA: sulfotransferase [Acidimicrobiia bacterium]|nr:sulfotransferase [Acidimicrobiia bacterium]
MSAWVPDELIAEAHAAAGLDDLGGESFRAGLAVYCDAVATEARLNDLGAIAIRANIVGSLVNRMRIVDWAARRPEVANERIDAPLVVIGMFRAGTTFLSYLLEQDARNRALLRWESGDSVPPPTVENIRSGPRVEAARLGNDMLEQINPRIRAIHHEEPDGPTECISLMSQDFKSLSWEAISNVPSYGAWLLEVDQRSAYEYHRLALQVLQSGGVRGRWTLKSPHHALNLDALSAVYPDARLVLLHRDPAVLCASVCSLIHTLSGTFSDADHRAYIAEHWVAMLEESIRRIDAFRARCPGHPIVDVQYEDLVRDPVGAVASIYGAVGESGGDGLDQPVRETMAAYVAAHPKGGLGSHGYDLAEFGLDRSRIAERFAGYVERYAVPTESAPTSA